MPVRVNLPPTLPQRLAESDRALIGLWVVSGSPVAAEIVGGSGIDLVWVDAEHTTNSLASLQLQLQVLAAYPVTPLVRLPVNDPVLIKQYLDLGAQNLIVPMVDTAAEASAAVRAAHYPPRGIRGVGSALSRGGRWSRVPDYLARASETISLTLQIESATAVGNAADIIAVDGVDSVFCGPSDLAATMGLIGQQDHPDVVAAVESVIALGVAAGVPVGVNAFAPDMAQRYLAAGAAYVFVGADVTILARGTEAIVDRFLGGS